MIITAKVLVDGEELVGSTTVDVAGVTAPPLWPVALIPILLPLVYVLALLLR